MKITYTLSLLAATFTFAGCASTQSVQTEPVQTESVEEMSVAPSMDSASTVQSEKTSYDGSTGSGLLMERYTSGRIEGYRD